MTEPRIEDAEDPKVTCDENFERYHLEEEPYDKFVREMSELITKTLASITDLKKQIDDLARKP